MIMSTTSNKERILQELVHGQECATQLQILFDNPCEETGHLSAEELVQNILRSLDQTISALSADQEVSQNQTTDCNDDEGSSESKKSPGSKDKRGCYKIKRGVQARKIVSASMEDGHAWRKYGQKKILNSKYPRGYFRCSHKHEQGCRALKQVQRMEDDPQVYEIAYIGTHTCIDSFSRAPQMIIPEYSETWESNHLGNQIPNPSAVKKETIEARDCTDLDSMVWKEIMGSDCDCTDLDSMVWKEIMGSDCDCTDLDSMVWKEIMGSDCDCTDLDSMVWKEIMGFDCDCTDLDSMVWKEIMGSDCGFLSNNNMGVGYENGFHVDEILSVL